MDQLKIETQETKLVAPGREYGGEQPLEIRVTLPEYLGDVVRVLRCTVSALPENVAVAGERLNANGSARVHIVYLADGDGVCAYDTSEPFTKSMEAPGIPEQVSVLPVYRADAPVCRAVSPRSLEIRTVVRMRFRVCERRTRSLAAEIKGGDVLTRKRELTVCDIENISAKQCSVSGVCPLPAENGPIGRILCADASCRVNETRVITNKAMVRGEVSVSVFYLADDGAPQTARLGLPFSEIVDAAGIGDGMLVRVSAEPLWASAEKKGAKESAREAECTAVIRLALTAEKMNRLTAATDVFSPAFELDAEYADLTAVEESRTVGESVTAEGRADLSRLQPQKILHHTERVDSVSVTSDETGVRLNGVVNVGMFVLSQEGEICFAESGIEFTFGKTLTGGAAACSFSPVLTMNSADVSLDGGVAVIRSEVYVEGRIDAVCTVGALTRVSLREDAPKARDSGLVIYFPTEGEQLWDIAKKYGASPELLRADNDLADEDAAPDGKPLLIARI